MSVLSPEATEASHIRYQLAQQRALLCPSALGQEIALTGSAAQGIADQDSDIEINFWVDALPSAAERAQWFQRVGATDVMLDAEPIADGSIWVTCRFRGVWIEAGWQTIAVLDKGLRAILGGEITDHDRLVLAATIAHAVPLRSSGPLAEWQQELSHYPDAVQRRLIAAATESWTFPHIVAARWALIRRGEYLALTQRLIWDTHNVLRLLFALNRQWEPDWKWIGPAVHTLSLKPDRLVERINGIFAVSQPAQRVVTCMQLILDSLALVPSSHDVALAIRTIEESLRLNISQLP